MNKSTTNFDEALKTLKAGVMPHIAERIQKAYLVGIGHAIELTAQPEPLHSVPRSDHHLPALLRTQAE